MKNTDWGVHCHNAYLSINDTNPIFNESLPFIVDVETDEKDNFCGLGLTQDGKTVYYYSRLDLIKGLFTPGIKLIGHNLKGDAKWLVKWGISLTSESLFADTMLMSYCVNATKPSHSLKDLGKELGMSWPTYKEMTTEGTLDTQPLLKVANYCAMDVLATYKLFLSLRKTMDAYATRIYNTIELPLMKVLFDMELAGVNIDVTKLNEVDKYLRLKLEGISFNLGNNLKAFFNLDEIEAPFGTKGKVIKHKLDNTNYNSTKQKAYFLEKKGFRLEYTEKGSASCKKAALERYLLQKDDEFIRLLIERSGTNKIYTSFTQPLIELTKREAKVYPTYNQLTMNDNGDDEGIHTGRLSCSNPNIQQIPTRSDEGKLLRELFVALPENSLIDADYSQIEPRIIAHFSKDPFLVNIFRSGTDLYDSLVEGVNLPQCKTHKERRDCGKTFMLALLYGAQAKKLASVFKCSEEEAQRIIDDMMRKIPGVIAWIMRVKHQAQISKGIFTLHKRWIPIPGITSGNKWDRMHWERVAINYTIQGSAAEVIKLAMIELSKKGYLPILTVHDELLFEYKEFDIFSNEDESPRQIRAIMETIVKLDVPIVAEVGTGENWRIAKDG